MSIWAFDIKQTIKQTIILTKQTYAYNLHYCFFLKSQVFEHVEKYFSCPFLPIWMEILMHFVAKCQFCNLQRPNLGHMQSFMPRNMPYGHIFF